MTNDFQLHRAAEALWQARETGQTIAPISETYGIRTLEHAYQVAGLNHQLRRDQGARVVGKKVGLTSRAVQTQLNVDQPDFGLLFADMEYLSGDEVPASRLVQPKAEAEVAFIVGSELGAEAVPSWSEFLASLSHALPAIEIVDSVITDWKISLADTVADNASCGLYVLGEQPVALGSLDLGALSMTMTRNQEVVSQGRGTDCLGHPLRAAWWLARTMAERGVGLKRGELILSGALGPMAPIEAGDLIEAQMGPFGQVTCRIGGTGV